MGIKKHILNINITNEPLSKSESSSFVLNLKKTEFEIDGLRPDQEQALKDLASNPEAARAPEVLSDWLKPAKIKSPLLDWRREKLRELMIYPFLRFVYRLSYKIGHVIYSDFRDLGKIVAQSQLSKKVAQSITGQFSFFKQRLSKYQVKLGIKWPRFGWGRRLNLLGLKCKQLLAANKDFWQSLHKKPEFIDKFDYYQKEKISQEEKIFDENKAREVLKKKGFKTPGLKFFLIFALIILIIVIPFKILAYYKLINFSGLQERVLGSSKSAIDNLMLATESATELKLDQASLNFAHAGNNFLSAQQEMANIDALILTLAGLSNNEKIKIASEGKKILAVGVVASELGKNLSSAFDSFFNVNNKNQPLGEKLDKFVNFGRLAIKNARTLEVELQAVDYTKLPDEYQDKFLVVRDKVQTLTGGLQEFINLAEELSKFLGVSQNKRYLLVFQNNNEMRASGGFIGSYALVDFKDGQIKNLEVPAGGSYDTEAGLRVQVAAPKPLQLVNPMWYFWDANWWPDWELTAKNLMWFYEKSDGPTVDGVISFTPTVLEKLLTVTGPIDMTVDYGVIVDSQNFWEVTQSIVEKVGNPEIYASSTDLGKKLTPLVRDNEIIDTQSEANKPKKIIGDLMNRILADLGGKLDKDNVIKILKIVDESLVQKHILLYFTDKQLQQKMVNNSWAGKIKPTTNDYLAVINTNIAGGKSDRKIQQRIVHKIEVQADNSIIDDLTITRTHLAVRGEPFAGVRNVDWLRVYVPRNSELLEAEGFAIPDPSYFEEPLPEWQENDYLKKTEGRAVIHKGSGTAMYQDSGKTVFANWSMVDPGETATIHLRYRLPFKLRSTMISNNFLTKVNSFLNPDKGDVYKYSLLVQKQAGALGGDYVNQLRLANGYQIFWKYPQNLGIISSGWNINDDLDSDKYYSILLTNK